MGTAVRRRKGLALLAVLLVLLTACAGEEKPLWQRLEEAQYDRYRPRLDHMTAKYGDRFEMNVYGTVSCTDPAYQDWGIHISSEGDTLIDDFAVRLRRDDIEAFIASLAEPIFGECRVYVFDGSDSVLDGDAAVEEFFTYKRGLVDCRICVPIGGDCRERGEALVAAIESRGYRMAQLDVLFFDAAQYAQADREAVSAWKVPEGYRTRLDVNWRYSDGALDSCVWRENLSLEHMTEKYGDLFAMDVQGEITCTAPEYQDWLIRVDDIESAQMRDSFAACLRRQELEAYIRELAEPVFGACKVLITHSRPADLDADSPIEDFFKGERSLLSCRILVPDQGSAGEDQAQGEAFLEVLKERRIKLYQLDVYHIDPAQYAAADREKPEDYRLWMDADRDDRTAKYVTYWRDW